MEMQQLPVVVEVRKELEQNMHKLESMLYAWSDVSIELIERQVQHAIDKLIIYAVVPNQNAKLKSFFDYASNTATVTPDNDFAKLCFMYLFDNEVAYTTYYPSICNQVNNVQQVGNIMHHICMYAPFGLICKVLHKDGDGWKTEDLHIDGIDTTTCYFKEGVQAEYKNVVPYLRPMSDMTQLEQDELSAICKEACNQQGAKLLGNEAGYVVHYTWMHNVLRYMHMHMLDYNDLIAKKQAITAKADMYKFNAQ
jgi:hypothetical protein